MSAPATWERGYALRFKSKHLKPLERRLNWLRACQATETANSYELAELTALEHAVAELRCLLDDRSDGGVSTDSTDGEDQ